MVLSNHILFQQLWMGLVDPHPDFDPPMDATTWVIRYSATLVEMMWTMVEREHKMVCVFVPVA